VSVQPLFCLIAIKAARPSSVRVAPLSCCVDLLSVPPRGADYFFTVAAVVAAAGTHASEGEVKMLSLA
jgi:hypothetical protein